MDKSTDLEISHRQTIDQHDEDDNKFLTVRRTKSQIAEENVEEYKKDLINVNFGFNTRA